jgi:hypothetical protein
VRDISSRCPSPHSLHALCRAVVSTSRPYASAAPENYPIHDIAARKKYPRWAPRHADCGLTPAAHACVAWFERKASTLSKGVINCLTEQDRIYKSLQSRTPNCGTPNGVEPRNSALHSATAHAFTHSGFQMARYIGPGAIIVLPGIMRYKSLDVVYSRTKISHAFLCLPLFILKAGCVLPGVLRYPPITAAYISTKIATHSTLAL